MCTCVAAYVPRLPNGALRTIVDQFSLSTMWAHWQQELSPAESFPWSKYHGVLKSENLEDSGNSSGSINSSYYETVIKGKASQVIYLSRILNVKREKTTESSGRGCQISLWGRSDVGKEGGRDLKLFYVVNANQGQTVTRAMPIGMETSLTAIKAVG